MHDTDWNLRHDFYVSKLARLYVCKKNKKMCLPVHIQ